MMKSVLRKILVSIEFYCALGILACFALLLYGQIRVEDVVLTRNDLEQRVRLPIFEKMGEGEHFQVSFAISNPLNLHYDLNIIPDDCVESMTVNGADIPLQGYSGKCDFSKGFLLEDSVIAKHRVGPRTTYVASLRNGGGSGGINVFLKGESFVSILEVVIAILMGVMLGSLARRRKWSAFLIVCIVLGVFLRFMMFGALPYTLFSNDVEGHLAYIQYIVDNHKVPAANDCWTCYHPPVYYMAAAPSLVAGSLFGFASSAGVQLFSLALSIILLFCGLSLLKDVLAGKALVLAAALWTMWPTLLLVAPRIGNDQMFYVLHALCLWGGVKYLNSGRGKFLLVAAIATALSYWTKTTGAVTMGVFFLFAIAGYIGNCRRLSATRSEVASWVIFALLVVGILVYKFVGDSSLIGNAQSLHSGLKVASEPGNFLYFDLQNFLMHPYTSPWKDEWGRQYFWNYAFKTALFGEFRLLETPLGNGLASLISLSFLGLVAIAVRGFWKTRLKAIHWILLLQGVTFFVALAFLRVKHPYACSNDFRYILPVLLSFIPFVGLGVNVEGASCKWKVLCGVSIAVFMLASVALMVNVALL